MGAVAVMALVIGQCNRGEVEESPERPASVLPAKMRKVADDNIVAWSKRFAIQRPPPEELRADPAQQAGMLENGIRYIVMEHPAAAGEISLRLMVLAGSMHEAPGEEGFAHFIEHLAFQETGHGHAFEVFERLGLAAGADLNAHTALDHTLYKLDLPSADETTLETACAFLSRTAGGMTFSEATVDDERRVILREIEERPESTRWCRKGAAILPGVQAVQHPPAGTKESIESARRAALWDFWHRHYVPSRMVVVAVGDLKAEPMIERLRRHFAEIPSRPAPAEPDPGDPMAVPSMAVMIDTEETSSRVTFTVAAPHPIDREPDSFGKRRDQLVRGVAMEMLENRLAREFDRLKIAGSPPDGKAAEVVPGIGWLEVSASSNPRDAEWVMRSLIRGWRSALAHEFHATEFAEARGDVRSALRAHFLSRITDDAADLATRLADSVRTGRLVQLPEEELNRRQADLATITGQECEARLKAEWAVPPRFFFGGRVDSSKQALASEVVTSAMGEPVAKVMHGEAARVWNPEAAGPPGRVIRRQLDEARGFLEAELYNRILVRLAPIPSLGGYVMVQVDAGYGDQSLPPGNAALGTAAETSEVLRDLVRSFRDQGWTRDEFQRALRPMPHVASRLARHPLAVLMHLQSPARMPAPGQLDPAALGAMEGAVRELARRVLDLDAAVELQVDR